MHLLILLKYALLLVTTKTTDCSIAGLTYMDPIKQMLCTDPLSPHCDSRKDLYWYPRPASSWNKMLSQPRPEPPIYSFTQHPQCLPSPPPTPCLTIPASVCLLPLCPTTEPNNSTTQPSTSSSVPVPTVATISHIPLPLAPNVVPQILPLSFPIFPPLIPIPPVPQTFPELPGLISKDGGINIMPFSDIYTDLYEKFKERVARRELKKLAKNKKIRKYILEVISLEETDEDINSDESPEMSREIGN